MGVGVLILVTWLNSGTVVMCLNEKCCRMNPLHPSLEDSMNYLPLNSSDPPPPPGHSVEDIQFCLELFPFTTSTVLYIMILPVSLLKTYTIKKKKIDFLFSFYDLNFKLLFCMIVR